MIRMLALAVVAIGLASCSDEPALMEPLASGDSILVASALSKALSDSVALAGATLQLPVTMRTSFNHDDSSVTVTEQFQLTKRPHQEFVAVGRRQEISGDRELLTSMYSFENSRGELRTDTEARFSSIGFGADQRGILRDLLARRLGLNGLIVDSTTFDGLGVRIVRFRGDGVAGALVLDHTSLTARSVTVVRESSSIIGGYRYRMTVQLTGPNSALRLPVTMYSTFHFDRLMSSGDGTLSMTIDTALATPTGQRDSLK